MLAVSGRANWMKHSVATETVRPLAMTVRPRNSSCLAMCFPTKMVGRAMKKSRARKMGMRTLSVRTMGQGFLPHRAR